MKFLIIALFFIGCASNTKKQKSIDIGNIENSDFRKVKQVVYHKKDDVLSGTKNEYAEVLNEESIDRVYKYDGDIKLTGTIGEIGRLCYEKKYDDAFTLVKNSNREYVKNPIFWNQVGTCYLLKGERRKSLLFYNKALSIDSNYAPALNNLGIMYIYENDYSRALIAFEKAKKAKDFSKTPRFNLANLYLNNSLMDNAIDELLVLIRISKNDVDLMNMLGTAYLMKNDLNKANEYFSKIPRKFLEFPQFGINYSLAIYQAGNKEKAIDLFEDVEIEKNHKQYEYYLKIGKILGAKI